MSEADNIISQLKSENDRLKSDNDTLQNIVEQMNVTLNRLIIRYVSGGKEAVYQLSAEVG